MANTVSPNMQLIIPGVGTEAGPTYATDINSSLTIIDQHNHASGSGVQITPNGLNINADFPINNHALTSVGSLNLQAQLSTPANNSVYESGVDLYFVDGNGNNIRMTQSGSVAGSAGTITGLPSGTASASFAAGTFTFQSATSTAAVIDGGSFVLRNNTASSFGLTLSPPNALGSNYTLTLPTIPAQTNAMNIDASGNMGSLTYDAVGQAMTSVGADAIGVTMTATGANAVAATRTRATGTTVAVGGVAISSSCGSFTTGSGSYVDVTNLIVTITTSGRPVQIMLISDASGTAPSDISNGAIGQLKILNGSTNVGEFLIGFGGGTGAPKVPPGAVCAVDAVAAGTYTYKVQALSTSGNTLVNYCKLVAYEL